MELVQYYSLKIKMQLKKCLHKESVQEAYKQNNNANAQYAVWLALAEMDLGASLQHFNVGYEQGFDKGTREMFNLPESYEMLAQMPFGSVEQETGEKEHIDADVQVKVFESLTFKSEINDKSLGILGNIT